MKKGKPKKTDDLRPEYDLRTLTVRRLGPERKSFGGSVIRLEPDVAEVFPSAEAVNEALRFLMRVAKENKPSPS
ncbi:MAG TPA: hypothetical protein VJS64_06910 [Pyrinomonadaceae bacterium]|nr:hypothetical protein [Pyrinomonadaceae bacterium]